jgi:hypothetical protein
MTPKAPKSPEARKATKAPKAAKAARPQPELLSYSTLIGASYSSVEMEEIPKLFNSADAQWRITFDNGTPINGNLIDVVLNDAAMKGARKAAKKAWQRSKYAVRKRNDLTEQEQDAEIEEMNKSFVGRFTPGENNEAYRQSIENGNRPLQEDFANLATRDPPATVFQRRRRARGYRSSLWK